MPSRFLDLGRSSTCDPVGREPRRAPSTVPSDGRTVSHHAIALAPENFLAGHLHLRADGARSLDGRVNVIELEQQQQRRAADARRRECVQ